MVNSQETKAKQGKYTAVRELRRVAQFHHFASLCPRTKTAISGRQVGDCVPLMWSPLITDTYRRTFIAVISHEYPGFLNHWYIISHKQSSKVDMFYFCIYSKNEEWWETSVGSKFLSATLSIVQTTTANYSIIARLNCDLWNNRMEQLYDKSLLCSSILLAYYPGLYLLYTVQFK